MKKHLLEKNKEVLKSLFKLFLNTIPRPLLIKLSYGIRPLLSIYYRGTTYLDPIDGKQFRSMLPYGYQHQRENVLSPSTLSLERHRLLWLFLKQETSFFKESLTLLHFAPEQAFYKRFKQLKNIRYTTTDLHSPLAEIKADICNLPFKDNSFDVILCNHVLEHIPDHKKAMSELYRVLKKGGWGIVQIPQDRSRTTTFEDDSITDPKERTKIFGQYDHLRVYGLDYPTFLRAVGFEVEMIDFTKKFSEHDINRYRLAKGELIPLIKKPI